MRIAFLTGIWPPDVGGPATHGPDFSRFLVERGHQVHVVTMGDGEPADAAVRGRGRVAEAPVSRSATGSWRFGLPATPAARTSSTRRRPMPLRRWRRCSRGGRSSSSSSPTRRTSARSATGSSPARWRSSSAHARGPCGCCKRLRNAALGRARHDRRARAPTWRRSRPAGDSIASRDPRAHEPRAAAARRRRRSSSPPGTFVFVGRLTRREGARHRDRGVRAGAGGAARRRRRRPRARRASRRTRRGPAADGRIEFRGSRSRDEALAIVAGADAALLSSDWENLPALGGRGALGRRARRRDRRSAACPRSSTTARTACSCRPAGRTSWRLRSGACSRSPGCATASPPRRSRRSAAISSEAIYGRLEALLVGGARDDAAPRVLFVGRGALRAAAADWLAKKWDASRSELDYRVLGAASAAARRADERFRLARPRRPRRARRARSSTCGSRSASRREISDVRARRDHRRPTRSSARPRSRAGGSPGSRTPVIVEVHGDWRTFTRLYGSRARRLAGPVRPTGSPRRPCGAPTRRARSRPSPRASSRRYAASRRR